MPDLPVTGGELTWMRHSVDTHLQGTAVIHRATLTNDGVGGRLWTYAAAGTASARLARLTADEFGGEERVQANRIIEMATLVLNLPAHTDITEADRVEYAGVTYEVLDVFSRPPDELVRRVRLKEID